MVPSPEVEEVVPEKVVHDTKADAKKIGELIVNSKAFRQNGVEYEVKPRTHAADDTVHRQFTASCKHQLAYCHFRALQILEKTTKERTTHQPPEGRPFRILLENLAYEREDEEREYCAPDERVDDHQYPPEDAAGGCAKSVGDDVARLAKESLEEQEQNEMHHAQRHIRKQE